MFHTTWSSGNNVSKGGVINLDLHSQIKFWSCDTISRKYRSLGFSDWAGKDTESQSCGIQVSHLAHFLDLKWKLSFAFRDSRQDYDHNTLSHSHAESIHLPCSTPCGNLFITLTMKKVHAISFLERVLKMKASYAMHISF